MPVQKQTASNKAKAAAKQVVEKYVTPKWISITIAAICISIIVAMLFGGWSIRETKERIKPLEKKDKVFEEQSKWEEKIIQQLLFSRDSMAKEMERKDKERTKQIIIIQQKKDDRVKEITKPDFSNDDIRRSFSE